MPIEPTLSDVHADLVQRLEQDKRLRAVEQQQAATNSEVSNLRGDIQRMENTAAQGFAELKQTIKESKPKYWTAVASLSAVAAVVLALFQALYSK